jgi:hypothetical protein
VGAVSQVVCGNVTVATGGARLGSPEPTKGDALAFILTRINVGDYEAWKPMFDQDKPGARSASTGWRIFRSVDEPGQVFIQVEFESVEDAQQGRERLLASGVLDRFSDKYGPTVVEEAETIGRQPGERPSSSA